MKSKKINQIPKERTYEEITAENDHLSRRVLELLSANAELERENNNLRAERDEQCEKLELVLSAELPSMKTAPPRPPLLSLNIHLVTSKLLTAST